MGTIVEHHEDMTTVTLIDAHTIAEWIIWEDGTRTLAHLVSLDPTS